MSELDQDFKSDEIPSAGFDRRSALKKAAAAGVVVWAAPMIASNTALAQGVVCTPKCAVPVDVDLIISATDACSTTIPEIPGTQNKIILFEINVPTTEKCPCSTTAPVIVLGAVPAQWDKVNGCDLPFVQWQATAAKVTSQGKQNQFTLYKNGGGAIGDGDYVPSGSFCVSVKCLDRDLTPVYRVCTFTVCISYSPSSAVCNTTYPVAVTYKSRSCITSCSPCP